MSTIESMDVLENIQRIHNRHKTIRCVFVLVMVF